MGPRALRPSWTKRRMPLDPRGITTPWNTSARQVTTCDLAHCFDRKLHSFPETAVRDSHCFGSVMSAEFLPSHHGSGTRPHTPTSSKRSQLRAFRITRRSSDFCWVLDQTSPRLQSGEYKVRPFALTYSISSGSKGGNQCTPPQLPNAPRIDATFHCLLRTLRML